MKSFNKINTARFSRTIKTLALGAVVAMTCSCEDFLTIYPTDKVVLENYWKTKTDVENVVANSYRMMLLPEFTERLIVWGELRGDNVIEGNYDPNKHGNIKNIMEANLLPQNGYNDWAHFYSIINNCNIVLKFAPQVLDEDPDFTEGDMNVTRGEMLAIRAMCHFYLVRAFRDIPLLDEAKVDDDQQLYQAQATPIEALDFILNDLYEAEGLVMESGSFPDMIDNKGRITKDAVRAMIADALLWKAAFVQQATPGDVTNAKPYYTECIKFCDSILNNRIKYVLQYEKEHKEVNASYTGRIDEKYPLIHHPLKATPNAARLDETYYRIFFEGNNLRESIFELQHSADNDAANYEIPYMYAEGSTAGPLSAPRYMAEVGTDNLYAKTDYRRISYVRIPESSEADIYPIAKYGYSYTSGKMDAPSYVTSVAIVTNAEDKHPYKDRKYIAKTLITSTGSESINWIMYRVSDVMLMKAEALAHRNDTLTQGNKDLAKSFELVKAVYYRSNPYNVTSADSISYVAGSAESMQELVLEERQRELAFEGKRWFDLVRKALRDNATGPMLDILVNHKYETNQKAIRSKMADLDCLFFPISEREIKTNPLLKQNDAYQTDDVFEKN